MKLHFLQHVPFEDLACIRKWADSKNVCVSRTRLYAGDDFPSADSFDTLVVMGGPMGVYDEDKYDWITDEKRFIDRSISDNKPTLGICLGAQMIAAVAGAKVYPNRYKEIGFFEVERTASDDDNNLLRTLPKNFRPFQWHGDTFDLPESAVHLASGRQCTNQAFQIGDRVLGLQFHLESTPESVEKLLDNCGGELIDAAYIQTADQIRNQLETLIYINPLMEQVMQNLSSTLK